jgi:hypothetical protein
MKQGRQMPPLMEVDVMEDTVKVKMTKDEMIVQLRQALRSR